jgi:hypothetical protein
MPFGSLDYPTTIFPTLALMLWPGLNLLGLVQEQEAGRGGGPDYCAAPRKLLPVQGDQLGRKKGRCGYINGSGSSQLVTRAETGSLNGESLIQGDQRRIRKLTDGQGVLPGQVKSAARSGQGRRRGWIG